MLRIDISTGIDEWFNWIPSIKSCISGKWLSIAIVLLWWYLDIDIAIINDE